MEALDIFLRQNRGKGPPGGWCSPRGGRGLEPDIMQLPAMANKSTNKNFIKKINLPISIYNKF